MAKKVEKNEPQAEPQVTETPQVSQSVTVCLGDKSGSLLVGGFFFVGTEKKEVPKENAEIKEAIKKGVLKLV